MSTAPAPTRSIVVLIAVSACWLLFPLLQWGRASQDAAPFLVAAELAIDGRPEAIYAANGVALSPEFARRSCEQLGEPTDCANVATPFISLPSALLLGVVVEPLPTDAATAVLRLGACVVMVAAMWSLRRRFPTTASGDALVAATAVTLTPYVYLVAYVGQNSPVLFLSACLGLGAASRRAEVGRSAIWSVAIALKAFPAALVVLLVPLRRWRFLALAAGWSALLLAAGLALSRPRALLDFFDGSSRFGGDALGKASNQSIAALAHQHLGASTVVAAAVLLAAVALAGAAWWWRIRFVSEDVQWAWAWVALIAVIPQSWWHYVVVVVAAVALTVAQRPSPDRWRVALPAAGAATSVLALPITYGPLLQVLQVGVVLATLVGVALLAPPRATS